MPVRPLKEVSVTSQPLAARPQAARVDLAVVSAQRRGKIPRKGGHNCKIDLGLGAVYAGMERGRCVDGRAAAVEERTIRSGR
ncbi:hypothetical protein Vau01_053260 [Virgisporangium aurantiacum]|uniref:Uncharacterized protein n=1 Tax=Virgisporangium aurantiacum TaxID=175570 RepID=A0A8J3Z9N4_9ACTN|nr:hypothetical protein Vau01_053260 [Virgisporangium aurantiacum]